MTDKMRQKSQPSTLHEHLKTEVEDESNSGQQSRIRRQETSPINVRGSRFKKFEYKDEESNLLYPADVKITPKNSELRPDSSRSRGRAGGRQERQQSPSKKQQNNSLGSQRKTSTSHGSVHYQILTRRHKDMKTLPGDAEIYEAKPPKVDYYDVFYFETRVRDMIAEYMDPIASAAKVDKENAVQLRYDYDAILERLHELESYALIQEWKLKPSKQFVALFEEEMAKKNTRVSPSPKGRGASQLPKKSNLKSQSVLPNKRTANVTIAKLPESPSNKSQSPRAIKPQRGPRDLINQLGSVSNQASVPSKTDLHKNLVKTSKRVAKEEAGLLNDRRIQQAVSENSDEDSSSLTSKESIQPMSATKAKQAYRTHFDDLNERIQALTVQQQEHQREYQDLFALSNAQTDEHKAFIKENDQERQINIQWAKVAFEKYEKMMADFKKFKEETNSLFNKSAKQYRDETLAMKAQVDGINSNQVMIRNKMELIDSNHKEFQVKREEMVMDITEINKKIILLETLKLNEASAIDSFQEIKDSMKAMDVVSEDLRNDLSTLENYCERYLPLNTLKVIQRLITPLFEEDHLRKLDKQADRFTMEMQQQILNDIGKGSIFEQIIKTNEYMTKRLQFKVDLQEALFRKENDEIMNKDGNNSENVIEKRLTRQDIKVIIAKKMTKVKRELDSQVKDIQAEGRTLQDNIDYTSKAMKNQMIAWQQEQEQYQHQLHTELLLLNDTRQNVTHLNEQIRLLLMLQKKTKTKQQAIATELRDAFDAIKKLKRNLTMEEVQVMNEEDEGQIGGIPNRKGAKSQQVVERHKTSTQTRLEDSIDGFGHFSSTKWETSQEQILAEASSSMNNSGPSLLQGRSVTNETKKRKSSVAESLPSTLKPQTRKGSTSHGFNQRIGLNKHLNNRSRSPSGTNVNETFKVTGFKNTMQRKQNRRSIQNQNVFEQSYQPSEPSMQVMKEYQNFHGHLEVGRGSSQQSADNKLFQSGGKIPMLKVRHKNYKQQIEHSAIDVLIQQKSNGRKARQMNNFGGTNDNNYDSSKLEYSPITTSAYEGGEHLSGRLISQQDQRQKSALGLNSADSSFKALKGANPFNQRIGSKQVHTKGSLSSFGGAPNGTVYGRDSSPGQKVTTLSFQKQESEEQSQSHEISAKTLTIQQKTQEH